METKPTIRLDPSTLQLYACPRQFYYTNMQGLVPKVGRTPLDFGKAIHLAVAEVHRAHARGAESPDEDTTIALAEQHYSASMCYKSEPRTVDNLIQCVRDYIRAYRVDEFVPLVAPDGDIAVEMPFEISYYEDDHLRVNLCGVVDRIGTINNGAVRVIQDTKHSSTYNMADYFDSYRASQQMMVYTWVMKELGWCDYYPPIQIDGIFISKKYPGAKCVRSTLLDFPAYQVERCMEYVRDVCRNLSAHIAAGRELPCNFSQCNGKYNMCEYLQLCSIPTEFHAGSIDLMFNKRIYNPAEF